MPHVRTLRGGPLLEREAELAELSRALDVAAQGRGKLAVIEASAGLGKTRLVDAAVELAAERGCLALRARGSQLERDFPFGVVRQLLERHLAGLDGTQRAALFAGAAGFCRPLFEDSAQAAAPAPADPAYATLHGLHWLLSNIAAQSPMLLAVDDAHWADASTLRFLAFLLPRLDELPLMLVVALRTAEPGAECPELSALVTGADAASLRLRPLSPDAVGELVGAVLASEPAAEFSAACHAASAGNPFYLDTLLRELATHELAPTADNAARVRRLGPPAVSRAVLVRLTALAREAPALARAVAVLGDGARIGEAAELGELEHDRLADVADLLVRGAILKRSERLEFIHPIVREAVYADLGPQQRAALHARAARLLEARGAPPERIAAQLLQSEPGADERVVDALEAAASDALARGAPETAAVYLRRALDEPPATERRAGVLHALGAAEAQLARAEAVEHLRQAREAAVDPRLRALAAHDLGLLLGVSCSVAEAVSLFEDAIDSLLPLDREVALELESELAAIATMDSHWARLLAPRAERLAAQISAATPAERAFLGQVALQMATACEPAAEVVPVAERALATPRWVIGRNPEAPQYFHALYVLAACDRYESCARHLGDAVDVARRSGSLITLSAASLHLARLGLRRGPLAAAEADAEQALELAGPQAAFALASLAVLVELLVERGALDAAERALAAYAPEGEIPDGKTFNKLLEGRAALRLAQRRPADALADFRELGRREQGLEAGNPALCAHRSGAALALAALGEQEQARALVADELALARRFGAPRAIGIALRASAIAAGGDGRIALLREAVAVLERSAARLEHARALVELGGALRRARRSADARATLDDGLALARRCEATALAERALDELGASGVRPAAHAAHDRDRLTPRERRVAQMAAEGLSNPQIAQALFVTTKTVETHLGHVYRKLAIRSRAQLAGALADEPVATGQPIG